MQGRPGDGGGAGCTRQRNPPTDGCCIQEEEDEAQTDMHAQHTQDIADEDSGGDSTDMYAHHTLGNEEGGGTVMHARACTQHTMNEIGGGSH